MPLLIAVKLVCDSYYGRPHCFLPMNHVTAQCDRVWDTGLDDKPILAQTNDAPAEGRLNSRSHDK